MSKVYTVKGRTSDVQVCDLCGRDDLQGTVAMVDQFGEVSHFGTSCAGIVAGWTIQETENKIKQAIRDEFEANLRDMQEEGKRRDAWMRAVTGEEQTFAQIKALGGLAAAMAAYRAAMGEGA